MVLLIGLLAYVGAVSVIQQMQGADQTVGWGTTLVLVLFPAAIWITYFYLLDRHEPEPAHLVLSAFVLGGLVAAPVANWVINEVYMVERWMALTPFSIQHIGASFLVVATVQELTKYLVVRYTVYLSDEFDEPADGVVYMTASGIGFAAALNFDYVSSGVVLTMGAISITITTLAHACFSGALGLAMGQARFSARGGQTMLVAGLLVAILLNGVFSLLQEMTLRPTMPLQPWRGLVLSGLFALVVFSAISFLMRRVVQSNAPPTLEEGR